MKEIKNAIIESVSINDGDRGLLTAWLYLEYDYGSQGFGGFALYLPDSYKYGGIDKGKPYCGHFIHRCMEIAGVSKWENIPGKTIRVDAEHGKVHGIGHITKDDWFYPAKDFGHDED